MKRLVALALVSGLASGLSVRAVDGSWSSDVDGVWSAFGNWEAGVVATGSSARAYFTNAITGPRVVANDYSNQAIGHLMFEPSAGNGWTVSGQPLALSVAGGAGSPTVSVASASAAISVRLTGTQGLAKVGAGVLVLLGNHTYTGATAVAAGSLVMTGSVLNSSVGLAAGTMLSAQFSQGLVGEFYNVAPVVVNNSNPNFATLPQFQSYVAGLNPVLLFNGPATGTNFDFAATGANFPPGSPTANFQARWKGTFVAPSSGDYFFSTSSDDGSMLWMDGVLVVTNNFNQGVTTREGGVALTAGPHEITMAYYNGSGLYGFYCDMALPGNVTNRLALASLLTGPAVGSITSAVGSVLNLSNAPITVAHSSTGNIEGVIVGSYPLRKIGNGRLALIADNSAFTGGFVLEGGSISIAADNALGAASAPLTFAGGTLRMFSTAPTTIDGRVVNWGSFNGGFDIGVTGVTFTITNVLSGAGSLAKFGPGTLVLSAVNTLTGLTTVSSGVLDVAASGSLASTTVVVNAGGTLLLESSTALSTNVVVSLFSGAGFGKVYLTNGVNQTVFALFINGAVQKAGTWGATGSGAANINDNYFSGAGILTVATGLGLVATDGSWGVNAGGDWGVTNNWVNGGMAFGTNATAFFTNGITADRTVNNAYTPLEIGKLSFAPTNQFNWFVTNGSMELAVTNVGATPTITVSSNNATVGSTTLGSQGLLKTGAGQLILTGQGLYSGTTTVSQGTLNLTGAGTLYNAGATPGAIDLAAGTRLVLNRSDVLGTHVNVSPVPTTAGAGALIFNTGAVFNTFNNLTLNGGELRANGGANATFQAFQLKGTITVSGATASLITGTRTINAFNQIQLGNNQTNGTTEISVADVTGNANADLVVSAGFADGRTALTPFNAVPSGFVKSGPGKVLLTGNNINSGPSSLTGGEIVVSGGVVNAAMSLAAGTMVSAEYGGGIVGEFYFTGNGTNPLSASFNTLQHFANHLANVTPTMLGVYNGPNNSTNFDFTTGGWPLVVNTNQYYEGRWAGKFIAPSAGTYSFLTASDDGSMLWVDGTNVVNNNAFQGTTSRTGTLALAAGPHDIVIAYYQGGGGLSMNASVALPGGTTNLLPLALLQTPPAIGALSGVAGSIVNVSNAPITIAQVSDSTYSGAFAGSNTVRKVGHGILTLTSDNSSFPGVFELGGGRVAISAANQLPLKPRFNGGVLRVTGISAPPVPHAINWSTFIGGFDVADPSNVFTVTNNIGSQTTLSSLWKHGPGELPITGSSNVLHLGMTVYTGRLTLAQSHTTVNGGLNVGGGGMLLVTNAYLASLSNITDSIANAPFQSGAALVLAGTGMFHKTQNNLIAGNAANAAGSILVKDSAFLSMAGGALFFGNGTAKGVLTVQDNATLRTTGGTSFMLGNSAGSTGVFYQTGGSLALASDLNVGRNGGSYGFFQRTAGSMTNSGNWLQVGAGGVGLFYNLGGTYSHTVNSLISGNNVNGSSTGVVWLAGGFQTNVNDLVPGWSTNSRNEWTISGGTVFAPNLKMHNTSNNTVVVNLNGGMLQVNSLYKNTVGAGATNVVNFNGGTLQARATGNLLGATNTKPDNVFIYSGGSTLDSSLYSAFIVPNLLAPPGDGVASIAVTGGGAGYIGAPYVFITGGGGTGATALAEINLVAGTVTNIIVSSRGVNYTTAPTVSLVGGGFATVATLGTVTTAANTSGGLTIKGSGSVALLGTNTYAGPTIISNGILLVNSTNTIAGSLILATNTGGIGPTYAMDQAFLDWLTNKIGGVGSGGVLALGTNSANNLDLTAFTNWFLGAAAGSQIFSGGITLPSTNVFLGGGNGTLVFQPNLVTGSNYFIGITGGNPLGVVTFSGTNDTYASGTIVQGGTARGARTNAFGGASATLTIQDGASLDINALNLGKVKVFVKGKGVGPNGAIMNSGGAAIPALQFVTLTGDATFGNPGRWDIRDGATGPKLDLAGFTMTKTGAVEITAFNCEVTDGNILIGQGIFRFEATATASNGAGQITVGPSAFLDFWGFNGAVTRSVAVNGGTISVGSGVASVGSPIQLVGTTNFFSPAAAAVLIATNIISGGGALVKSGIGVVKLSRTESYTGATLVHTGVLELASADANDGTISSSSGLTINGPGVVHVDRDTALFGTNTRPVTIGSGGMIASTNGVSPRINFPLSIASGTINGGGSPHALNGNWIIESNITFTGTSLIAAPRTQLGVPGGTTFDIPTGASLVVSGALEDPGLGTTGTGTLIKVGAGTLALRGTNTYTGATIVNGGTLKLGLPAGSLQNRWSFNNTNLLDSAGTNHAFVLPGTINQLSYSAGAVNLPGGVRGSGAVIGLGTNLLRHDGSPYTIEMWVTQNAVQQWARIFDFNDNSTANFLLMTFSQASNGAQDRVEFKNGNLASAFTDNTCAPYTLGTNYHIAMVVFPGSGSDGRTVLRWYKAPATDPTIGAARGSNVTTFTTGSYNMLNMHLGRSPFAADADASASYDEVRLWNTALTEAELNAHQALGPDALGGTIPALPAVSPVLLATGTTLDLGGSSPTIATLADQGIGGGTVTNSGAFGSTLTLGADATNTTFTGTIRDGAGSIALVKNGTGTQTLNGPATYSAGLTLNTGTLLINGNHSGTGQVLIFGGTLGGTGSIGGTVINAAGTIAPGNSPGRLTILGDLATAGNLDLELAGTNSYDQLLIGGTASLGGTLNITTNTGYTPATGHTFTLLTATNPITTTFGAVNLPALADPSLGWDLQYTTNTITLSITGAPPAATGYTAWSNLYVLTTGPEADQDGDGYANLLEYVTGANPTNADTLARMNAARTNGLLALKFTRDTNTIDATLIVEGANSATNNADWTGIATNLAGSWGTATNVVESAGSPANVTAYDTAPATNRFLRLRITRP